ncbi:MAG: ATP-binding protein [Sedimentisphaerales bacterium]|nr:ATP-binding protein [Sedimentisphaerales bacterium]
MMDSKSVIKEYQQAELNKDEFLRRLDNINNDQTEIISIVLQDLKRPLRSIEALANWILSNCADKLGDQANNQMDLLLKRVERMYNLIESALEYSRAGQTNGERIQVNLNNFVPEIINMVIVPENITVTIENELPVIECEELQIMQIFQNLLNNAIKYMDKPHGWIKIGCIEQKNSWEFSITDNGPGIEKMHFEKYLIYSRAFLPPPTSQAAVSGLPWLRKLSSCMTEKYGLNHKLVKEAVSYLLC